MNARAAVSIQPSAVSEDQQPTSLVLPWIFACAEVLRVPPKLLGERAECAFLAEAMARGLIVSKPYGDSAPYDFIVERRRPSGLGHRPKRKLWKIQVKSVSTRDAENRFQANARHGAYRSYDPSEVDFFALWVVPLDRWYIVPARALLPAKRAYLYPHVAGSKGRYEKYREAWHLIG